MMVHACTPSTQEAEAKDQELEVSLGYIIARLSQKNIYLYMCVNILYIHTHTHAHTHAHNTHKLITSGR
jgi:hypothetical protein